MIDRTEWLGSSKIYVWNFIKRSIFYAKFLKTALLCDIV